MMAPVMTQGLRLYLTGQIISTSYINITIQLMSQFGAVVEQEGQTFTIPPQSYTSVDHFTVESDWSAASYWYEMVALCEDERTTVSLPGLQLDSLQGDAGIVDLFNTLGVETTFTPSGVTLRKKQQNPKRTPTFAASDAPPPKSQQIPKGKLCYDLISMPDLAQTLAVACIMLNRPFRFTGLQSLKIKETDRLLALQTELQKLGYPTEILDDRTLEWTGRHTPVNTQLTENDHDNDHNDHCDKVSHISNPNPAPLISTYNDHRMAMSFAPISFHIREGIYIADPEVVSKSYPFFWNDLQKAGFEITESHPANISESLAINTAIIRENPCNPWTDFVCCGQHEVCEHTHPMANRTKIAYYNDESLDIYSDLDPAQYDESAIAAFNEVFNAMPPGDVSGWLYSLHLRNIHLPDPLQDEAFLIIGEQHKNR